MSRRRLVRVAAGAIFLLAGVALAADEVAVPPLKARVTDLTGTLTAAQIQTLEGRLRDFERGKGSQIAVLILPSTQPETIEQYSIRKSAARASTTASSSSSPRTTGNFASKSAAASKAPFPTRLRSAW